MYPFRYGWILGKKHLICSIISWSMWVTKGNTINPCSSSRSCSNILTLGVVGGKCKHFRRFVLSQINKNNYYLLHVHKPESAIEKVLLSAKIGLKAITTTFSNPCTTTTALFLENIKPFLWSQHALTCWQNASVTSHGQMEIYLGQLKTLTKLRLSFRSWLLCLLWALCVHSAKYYAPPKPIFSSLW